MKRLVVILILAFAASHARVQAASGADEMTERGVYASIENSVRHEVETRLAALARSAGRQSPEQIARATHIIKFIAHNRAVIYVTCVVEAQKDRYPGRFRTGEFLQRLVNLCLDDKMRHLQRFTQLIEFVGLFGASRIPDCEKSARLPDLEHLLPAFEFLELNDPRLYDFAEYNKCLMPGN